MSWERVEAWPGAEAGGAFRGAAEPVVAERRGVTWRERARLFWHSSPEHPLARTAERVAVTPRHVYVERRDRARVRLPLERLHGARLDAGQVVYGVREGEDLLLPYRAGCPVQLQLDAAARGGAPVDPYETTEGQVGALVVLWMAGCGALSLLMSYPPSEAVERIRGGLFLAESALGTYAGIAAALLALLALLLGSSRWRIDAVTVRRTRGILPFLTFSLPPEEVRRAVVRHEWSDPNRGPRRRVGVSVHLELVRPRRLGTLRPHLRHAITRRSFSRTHPTEQETADAQALALAERLHALLGLGTPFERELA